MPKNRRALPALLLTAAVLTTVCSLAHAQSGGGGESVDAFPSKPVFIMVPYEGDGSISQELRIINQNILENTGKTILLDHKGGAGTTVGTAVAARYAPNGYGLLAVGTPFTITPAIYPSLPYDNIRDFAPISLLDKRLFLLVVPPSSPFKTVQDFISYARANPGAVNVSTSGVGGTDHMAAALLHNLTNTQVVFIHHKAPSGRLLDVMANRVHATTVSVVSGIPPIRAGKFRAIAVASGQRSTHLPDLPSIAEQGVPEYDFSSWVGLFATAKTPAPIINKLNTMFVNAIRHPAVASKIEPQGSVIVGSSPEELRKFVASETARWKKVVKDMGGISPEE